MSQELWKDIPRFEGIYQASTHGRVRTHKDKTTYTKRHGIRRWKQRILKYKGANPVTGYRVSLWKNGKQKDFLVARLVATTFLADMIKTKMTVNHKDGNRFNNFIENLEWLTLGDNIRHAFDTGLMPTNKRIKLTNLKTKKVVELRSMVVASKHIGYAQNYISKNLKRGITQNKKWKWEVLNE